jgi:hypothetical protein
MSQQSVEMKQPLREGFASSPVYDFHSGRDAMSNSARVETGRVHGARTGRRRPILRVVIIALLLAALVEPLVMYRSLMRERAERRALTEITLRSPSSADDGAR